MRILKLITFLALTTSLLAQETTPFYSVHPEEPIACESGSILKTTSQTEENCPRCPEGDSADGDEGCTAEDYSNDQNTYRFETNSDGSIKKMTIREVSHTTTTSFEYADGGALISMTVATDYASCSDPFSYIYTFCSPDERGNPTRHRRHFMGESYGGLVSGSGDYITGASSSGVALGKISIASFGKITYLVSANGKDSTHYYYGNYSYGLDSIVQFSSYNSRADNDICDLPPCNRDIVRRTVTRFTTSDAKCEFFLKRTKFSVSGLPAECVLSFGSIDNPTGGLTFSDPCSCNDAGNCRDASTGKYYFRDVLRIPATGTTTSGLTITIDDIGSNFYIDVPCKAGGGSLTPPTSGSTQIAETSAGSGIYELVFWRESGMPTTGLSVNSSLSGNQSIPDSTFEPFCSESQCATESIPTLGEWGLMLLGLMTLIAGVVYIRQRSIVIA